MPDLEDSPCSESNLYGPIKFIVGQEDRVTRQDSVVCGPKLQKLVALDALDILLALVD